MPDWIGLSSVLRTRQHRVSKKKQAKLFFL